METAVIIAVISALGSIIAAAMSYHFSRKREIEADWRNQKLVTYKELLSALSDAAIHGINHNKAQERFANAFNTIALEHPSPFSNDFWNSTLRFVWAIPVLQKRGTMRCYRVWFLK